MTPERSSRNTNKYRKLLKAKRKNALINREHSTARKIILNKYIPEYFGLLITNKAKLDELYLTILLDKNTDDDVKEVLGEALAIAFVDFQKYNHYEAPIQDFQWFGTESIDGTFTTISGSLGDFMMNNNISGGDL